MIEGELKKKLNSKVCRFSEHGGKWVSMAQVNDILDEAKNEFPKVQLEYYGSQYGEKDVPREYVVKFEALKWFKRWFGDSP